NQQNRCDGCQIKRERSRIAGAKRAAGNGDDNAKPQGSGEGQQHAPEVEGADAWIEREREANKRHENGDNRLPAQSFRTERAQNYGRDQREQVEDQNGQPKRNCSDGAQQGPRVTGGDSAQTYGKPTVPRREPNRAVLDGEPSGQHQSREHESGCSQGERITAGMEGDDS